MANVVITILIIVVLPVGITANFRRIVANVVVMRCTDLAPSVMASVGRCGGEM